MPPFKESWMLSTELTKAPACLILVSGTEKQQSDIKEIFA